jgi:hypothetical protein
MKQSDLKPGVRLRVVRDRWEVLRGTLAEVESVGYVGNPPTWYFRVWWLIPESTRQKCHVSVICITAALLPLNCMKH